jgi:hypothetical protein
MKSVVASACGAFIAVALSLAGLSAWHGRMVGPSVTAMHARNTRIGVPNSIPGGANAPISDPEREIASLP